MLVRQICINSKERSWVNGLIQKKNYNPPAQHLLLCVKHHGTELYFVSNYFLYIIPTSSSVPSSQREGKIPHVIYSSQKLKGRVL